MIIYKEAEKLRAEAYKSIGYFFGSVVGLTLINILVYGANCTSYLNIRGVVIIISVPLAYYFVGIGVKIMRQIDVNNSKTTLSDTISKRGG